MAFSENQESFILLTLNFLFSREDFLSANFDIANDNFIIRYSCNRYSIFAFKNFWLRLCCAMDYTGMGNTLNMMQPRALQLITDSLRYWVTEMHVDGFRFDLASTLARELYEVDKLGAFFDIIHQDPIISQVKLIAEPWDLGEGGYQVGNFPVLWAEWNGKYRDAVRL